MLSRGEVRDLVDAQHLERAGCSLEAAFELAQRKDGGLSAAQLAWVLGEIRIGDDARIPSDTKPAELRAYITSLRERLERSSFPR